jgi:hypothetical protein
MNLGDYILALNKATAGKPDTAQPSGKGDAPTTGVEPAPKPSAWTLFFGDLLDLAQAQWAPAGWVPFKLQ